MTYLPQIRILVPSAQVSSYTTGSFNLPSARSAFFSSENRAVISRKANGNSTMDSVIISSTGNAIDFGDATIAAKGGAGCGSSTRGLIAGGSTTDGNTNTTNVIEYFGYTTLQNAVDFGDLAQNLENISGCSNSTRALFAQGQVDGAAAQQQVAYVTIATTGNVTNFGNVYSTRQSAGCASSTRGVFGGGYVTNQIEFVTIASTGNGTDFGDLLAATWGISSSSSSTRGLFAGGDTGSYTNVIQYITIASAGNATDFGDLTVARFAPSSGSSSTRAIFNAGIDAVGITNIIDYVEIATTGNAVDFGDTIGSFYFAGTATNGHGGL